MKTLFFIITAVGLVYLMLSSMDKSRFSFSPTETVKQADNAFPAEPQSGGDTLLKVISDIEALSSSQQALQQEVNLVSMTNSELVEALKALDEKVSKEPALVSAASDKATSLTANKQAIEVKAHPQGDHEKPAGGALQQLLTEPAQNTEQEKRIRQQALLRDLAQKRQFAAIDALQTASSY